ncbi:hypothetical protein PR048_022429 [Dryococelus australis]|uniref:Uncharacterized protein n=1 Tax=Dryococelus australis TaxID=614101 RepID=A0ABQ9H0Y3_9NEOP|nr:hypothetical protein PR048_022429 [Dryococelus australis]
MKRLRDGNESHTAGSIGQQERKTGYFEMFQWVNVRTQSNRVGRKAVQCWDTKVNCAQTARSVYLIFSLCCHQHVGASFTNQRLVTHLPVDSQPNSELFTTSCSSQSDTWPTSDSQSDNEYVRIKGTAMAFRLCSSSPTSDCVPGFPVSRRGACEPTRSHGSRALLAKSADHYPPRFVQHRRRGDPLLSLHLLGSMHLLAQFDEDVVHKRSRQCHTPLVHTVFDTSWRTLAQSSRFPLWQQTPNGQFSHVGIPPDNAAGRRVFSGISRFPPLFHSGAAPFSPHFTRIGSQDLAAKSRLNILAQSRHSSSQWSPKKSKRNILPASRQDQDNTREREREREVNLSATHHDVVPLYLYLLARQLLALQFQAAQTETTQHIYNKQHRYKQASHTHRGGSQAAASITKRTQNDSELEDLHTYERGDGKPLISGNNDQCSRREGLTAARRGGGEDQDRKPRPPRMRTATDRTTGCVQCDRNTLPYLALTPLTANDFTPLPNPDTHATIEQRRNEKAGGNREIPEKTRQLAAPSGTIPTCGNPGVGSPPLSACETTPPLTKRPGRALKYTGVGLRNQRTGREKMSWRLEGA